MIFLPLSDRPSVTLSRPCPASPPSSAGCDGNTVGSSPPKTSDNTEPLDDDYTEGEIFRLIFLVFKGRSFYI